MRVPELVDAVAAAGMPAVAVTDQSNLFAMVKFYRAALSAGVKPIVGVDLLVREAGERAAALAADPAVPDRRPATATSRAWSAAPTSKASSAASPLHRARLARRARASPA